MSIVKEKLNLLKRKQSTIRAAISKLNDPTRVKTDLEYSVVRLQDKISELTLADDKIHELLNDEEYNEDIIDCEKYTEKAHLMMFTYKENTSTNFSLPRLPISDSINSALLPTADGINYASASSNISVNLPTVKITTFRGEIE
ncbi:hypothetical protein NPIL_504501 [Nephila pilipes]|uniref:Uncharacterized protein n=1 Tax=Nephila pilipes TaxID=299642 RepID=A0A8X6Q2R0_NEPPI|nr:hypothetical protein NPIL_504501 [Nephila pilipes]